MVPTRNLKTFKKKFEGKDGYKKPGFHVTEILKILFFRILELDLLIYLKSSLNTP